MRVLDVLQLGTEATPDGTPGSEAVAVFSVRVQQVCLGRGIMVMAIS